MIEVSYLQVPGAPTGVWLGMHSLLAWNQCFWTGRMADRCSAAQGPAGKQALQVSPSLFAEWTGGALHLVGRHIFNDDGAHGYGRANDLLPDAV
jgi:hypothetical protein